MPVGIPSSVPGAASGKAAVNYKMKIGLTVALVVMMALLIGGLVFHKDLSDFMDSMRADGMEGSISFGRALDASGRFVLNSTTSFQLSENVAWVVHFKKGVHTKELVVALFELTRDGTEIPLGKNKIAVEPTDEGVYNLAPAQVFWSLSPKGSDATHHAYRVKYLKDRVVAQGDFVIGSSPGDP